jgi:uncharacterized spore protein YtfJ
MFGDVSETLDSMRTSLTERLGAQIAYGEPVVVEGVTVIPVARVMLGFGGGGGVGESQRGNGDAPPPAGGGGGGGGMVQPLGFIEITREGARWAPLEPAASEVALRTLAMAAVILPFGGRRFFLGRLAAMVATQLLVSRLLQPNLPPLPEGVRFGRFARNEA